MKIRPAKLKEAKAILAIYTPYVEETTITFETQVPSLEAFESRMAAIMEKRPDAPHPVRHHHTNGGMPPRCYKIR